MGAVKWWKRQRERRRLVRTLLVRDGDQCWLCTRPISRGRETLEHLIAQALGGTDALENLVLCHHGCNVHLKDRPLEQKLKMRAKWHRNASYRSVFPKTSTDC